MAKEKAIPQVFFAQGNHVFKKYYYSYVSDAFHCIQSIDRKNYL